MPSCVFGVRNLRGMAKESKMPDVVPFLTYEDGIAALEWLTEISGFTRKLASRLPMGGCRRRNVDWGWTIMLASPSPDYEGPKRHRNNCAIAALWSALHGSLMVFSSMLRTSMSTMLGLRPQEPLSCLNRRMGRQRDDIELRI